MERGMLCFATALHIGDQTPLLVIYGWRRHHGAFLSASPSMSDALCVGMLLSVAMPLLKMWNKLWCVLYIVTSIIFYVLAAAGLCCLHVKSPPHFCSEQEVHLDKASLGGVCSKEPDSRLTQAVGRLRLQSQPELCKLGWAFQLISSPRRSCLCLALGLVSGSWYHAWHLEQHLEERLFFLA